MMSKFVNILLLSICLLIIGSIISFIYANNDSLIYYQNGKKEYISNDKMPKVLERIDALTTGIDDVLKLIVLEDTIDELKSEKCFEVILSKPREVKANDFSKQSFTYQRFLIPLCDGDTCSKNTAVFYFGNRNTYFSPPFINTKGGKYRDEIRKIIGK